MSGFSGIHRRDDRDDQYLTLEGCYVHRLTDAAVQITYEGEVFWVPKSVIREPDQLARWQEDADIDVKEWFARKNELI